MKGWDSSSMGTILNHPYDFDICVVLLSDDFLATNTCRNSVDFPKTEVMEKIIDIEVTDFDYTFRESEESISTADSQLSLHSNVPSEVDGKVIFISTCTLLTYLLLFLCPLANKNLQNRLCHWLYDWILLW
jgi:hypothetical protein